MTAQIVASEASILRLRVGLGGPEKQSQSLVRPLAFLTGRACETQKPFCEEQKLSGAIYYALNSVTECNCAKEPHFGVVVGVQSTYTVWLICLARILPYSQNQQV